MRPSVACLLLLILGGCGESPPPCSNTGSFESAPSAGCLIWDQRGALLVKDFSDEWALPGGSVAEGESARCGAEREAFEETGMTARSGLLAAVFENEFHLYWCEVSPTAEPVIHRPLEVAELIWWQLEALPDGSWRYPGQGETIRDLILARVAPVTDESGRVAHPAN